jgi:hypothetical protein
MKIKRLIAKNFIFVSVIMLSSCGQKDSEPEVTQILPEAEPVKTMVYSTSFQQKGCPRKACKDYQIVIEADQSYSFNSEELKSKGQLTGKQKTELRVLLEALKLTNMTTKLKPGSADCLKHRTEAPNYNLKLTKGELSQSLGFYGGCEPLPKAYNNLMQWFNQLALAQRQPAF